VETLRVAPVTAVYWHCFHSHFWLSGILRGTQL
jgi:hypothetical protein